MPTITYNHELTYTNSTFNFGGGGLVGGVQMAPDITALQGGGYMLVWLASGTAGSLQMRSINGTDQSSVVSFGGSVPHRLPVITTLTNGNVAIAWTDTGTPDQQNLQIRNASTLALVGSNAYDGIGYGGQPSITTRGSGVLTGYGDDGWGSEEGTLWAFNSSGGNDTSFNGPLFSYAMLNHAPATRVVNVAVAELTDGRIAAVWRDEASTALYWRIFNANGGVSQAGGVFDDVGSNGAPKIAATGSGGFVVGYSDDGWASGNQDVTLARFSGTGFAGFSRVTSGGEVDAFLDIDVHENGMVTVLHGQDSTTVLPGFVFDTRRTLLMTSFNADGTPVLPTADLITSSAFASTANFVAREGGQMGLAWATAPAFDADGDSTAIAFSALRLVRTTLGDATGESLTGDMLTDSIDGAAGNDQLQGAGGNDTLLGGMGDDTLLGGIGADDMRGGAGADLYQVDNAADVIVEQGVDTDTVFVGADGWTMAAGLEIARLFGSATILTSAVSTAAQLVSNPNASSTLTGGSGADVLWSSALADSLVGSGGDDTIRGQGGADTMAGGLGNDHFVAMDTGVVLQEAPGEGTDTLWVAVQGMTLTALNIEIIRLAGSTTSFTGSAFDEQIVAHPTLGTALNGGGGNDVLYGGAGNDALSGGEGDDILRGEGGFNSYTGGNGNDQFVLLSAPSFLLEQADGGYDTIWTSADNLTMAANVERMNLSGTAYRGTGNASDNVIVGNPGLANSLAGAAGADTLYGSALGDTLIGGTGNDVLYGEGGADRFIYDALGWGYDQVAGFTQGQARIDFRGTGLQFSGLVLNSAGGNTQVEQGGNAILVFGVAAMTAADFIFDPPL